MSDDNSERRGRIVPAVAAGLLFGTMALTALSADFAVGGAGFPADASVEVEYR